MSLIVQKYGGACLANTEKIAKVASQIQSLVQSGHQIVVVVSAMGSTTDELLELAHSVSPSPNRRELDMLLTAGERMSMSLLSIALNHLGQPAISFTGSQAGILTDQSHSGARITDIKPQRVVDSLNLGKVVILAGFQGVDPISKEVTTLGRGGSDTTAVALAKVLKADQCQILKEVKGFCSGDPDMVKNPITHTKIDYSTAAELCFWGAEILHYRSVELAWKTNIPLYIGHAWSPNTGTMIGEESMFENQQVTGANLIDQCLTLQLPAKTLSAGIQSLNSIAKNSQVTTPKIFASSHEDQKLRMMIHCPNEDKNLIKIGLEKIGGELLNEDSLIAVTSFGSIGSDLLEKVTLALAKESIQVKKVLMSSTTMSLSVDREKGPKALECVHSFIPS